MAQLIPFAELTGGTDTVRFTVIKGKTYMSVHDIIMLVCTQTQKHACVTWDRLEEDKKWRLPHFVETSNFPAKVRRHSL